MNNPPHEKHEPPAVPDDQLTSEQIVAPALPGEAAISDDDPARADSGSPAKPAVDRRFFVRVAIQAGALLAASVVVIVLLGLAQRIGWITATGPPSVATDPAGGVVYTCPMHPQIRQPGPGRCPICGMPLEPAVSAGAIQDEYAVHVEPAARRLANIQTARVERRVVEHRISTVGAIAADESRLATIAAYVDGRLERLFADYTGVEVARGDHLAVLYSPALYSAQVEYVESRRALEAASDGMLPTVRRMQQRLAENARQKLVELGMTEEQLEELEATGQARARLTIYTPIAGTVLEKLAVEGKYVEVGEPIYRIANLSLVWLMLELYPEDAALVRFGQQVEAEVQSLPGQVFTGRVAFIAPVVDQRTRTVGVRVEMLNEHRKLRPGDYARARIAVPVGAEGEVYDAELAGKWISPMHPQIIREEPGECPICGMDLVPTSRYGYAADPVPQTAALVVPRDALLKAGPHSLVYVETETGRFEIRPVVMGPILRDEAVIISGVKEGEMVATSGNFLIDSQMQLAGKPSLIDPARAIARAAQPPGPLDLDDREATRVAGTAGDGLEQLYQAYFAIQAALAEDRPPNADEVQRLMSTGRALRTAEELPPNVSTKVEEVLQNAEHLHHMSLDDARKHFKPISHNVLRLAAQYRGEMAVESYIHFYCAMVPDGGGDWLQASHPPANPYWGSRMLRCVQHEEKLPPPNEGPDADHNRSVDESREPESLAR